MFAPTAEQQRAIDAFLTGDNMTIEAGAGTGKTTTLKQIAAAAPNRKGLYIAYNSAIAKESAASFPSNVECRTAHSVAYRWTAAQWNGALRERLNSPRVPMRETARMLESWDPVRVSADIVLAPQRIASLAMRTVQNWCYTGATQISGRHVPMVPRLEDPEIRATLADVIVPMAQRAWEDLSRPNGKLRFIHDHYLKLWALSNPSLSYDFIMVDEAQDSNGVVTGVVRQQTSQVAAVGDRCQSIYAWRGATDAMDAFGSKHHVFLTQSFRFGKAIADEANKWLELLGSDLRLKGYDKINSRLRPMPDARAVLCRSNAAVIQTVLECHRRGVDVALVGNGAEIVTFARAARDLMDKGWTSHPDLMAFDSWPMVKEYVEDSYDGSDLAVLVKLVEEHKPEGIIKAIEGCADERTAQVTVSTAHKAKGREWKSVRIAKDFDHGQNEETEVGAEGMLAYVAVTRAMEDLDREGLAWVDKLIVHRRVGASVATV